MKRFTREEKHQAVKRYYTERISYRELG
ncbi:hypothetical protein SAMN05421743_13114, partial [Thalassobacillus cyri]